MYKVDLEESFFPAQSDTHYAELTIADMMRQQAAERSDQIALRELRDDGSVGRIWTYAELLHDAERLGRALASRHPAGARIAVFANNMPEWILLELGSAFAGLVLVTVNPAYSPRELTYVLEQSRSEGLYFADTVRGTALAPIVEAATQSLPAVVHKIRLADTAALFEGEDVGILRDTRPSDVVQIQYTSGTTGFPKGALLHQKGLIQNGTDILRRWHLPPGEELLIMMPLFHTTGCAIMVLGGLATGASLLLAPGFDGPMIAEVLVREQTPYFVAVPTMMVVLIDIAEANGLDMRFVKSIASGGSMVPPELVRRAQDVFGVSIQIVYGQTEASPVITSAWSTDSEADLSGTIGQPMPHMDVAILNTTDNQVCGIGEQGEICARGYMVMTGYNDNPKATAETIDEDGWLHTGDLGRMDSRGYLRITGRVKEMIIRGGENLFPAEIENALLEHPDVLEAAIVGIPDDKWGETVAAFMRGRPGEGRPDANALKAFMRERLSPQKTPQYWIWVDEWPLTGSGKIQRFALRDGFVDGNFHAETV